jgi:ADP-ribosylglycohydrolase
MTMNKHITPAVLVGQAVGDSLGMPFEASGDKIHKNLATWDGSMLPGTWHKLPAGQWTDDTEMATALAESLVEHKGYNPADAAKRYLAWSQGTPHGMGGTTRKAMQALAEGKSWSESGVTAETPETVGNGTAMRVAPMGVAFNGDTQMEMLERAASDDAFITHAHVEAVAASFAIALTVDACLRKHLSGNRLLLAASMAARRAAPDGKPATQVSLAIDRAIVLYGEGATPAQVIMKLGRHGNAIETVSTALYCAAFHCDDFEAGVQAAIRGGGDTDTRGAIAGAILGARLGLEGIPKKYLDVLHQLDYLRDLDQKLLALRGM